MNIKKKQSTMGDVPLGQYTMTKEGFGPVGTVITITRTERGRCVAGVHGYESSGMDWSHGMTGEYWTQCGAPADFVVNPCKLRFCETHMRMRCEKK